MRRMSTDKAIGWAMGESVVLSKTPMICSNNFGVATMVS